MQTTYNFWKYNFKFFTCIYYDIIYITGNLIIHCRATPDTVWTTTNLHCSDIEPVVAQHWIHWYIHQNIFTISLFFNFSFHWNVFPLHFLFDGRNGLGQSYIYRKTGFQYSKNSKSSETLWQLKKFCRILWRLSLCWRGAASWTGWSGLRVSTTWTVTGS